MTPAAVARTYAAVANAATPQPPDAGKAAGAPDFAGMLGAAMGDLVQAGRAAEQTGMAGIAGRTDPVNVVTAVAETELALETVVSIRDKVIAAYEDILRMPI